jgi:hypothetical protein
MDSSGSEHNPLTGSIVYCECVEWIHLAQNTTHLQAELYAVMKICDPRKSRELLSHIVRCSHAMAGKIEAAAYSSGEAALNL